MEVGWGGRVYRMDVVRLSRVDSNEGQVFVYIQVRRVRDNFGYLRMDLFVLQFIVGISNRLVRKRLYLFYYLDSFFWCVGFVY